MCGGLMCERGIHMQLIYTVINMWRINMWRGHSHAANIHGNQHTGKGLFTHGGGTHVQLPYTVLAYREGGGGIPVLLLYNLCGYHTASGWLLDSVWLPYNCHVTTIQHPCGGP